MENVKFLGVQYEVYINGKPKIDRIVIARCDTMDEARKIKTLFDGKFDYKKVMINSVDYVVIVKD
jgi:hypothetical protein